MFERELLSVPVMRQVLGDTLRGIGVNEDSVADILLAATEACTNVVLHAGQSAAPYAVAATVDSAACRVEVTDGCFLPGGRPPVPPGVCLRGPDRKRRDLIRPAQANGELAGPAQANGELAGPAQANGELAESGRGFAIMAACMDAVTLNSAPGQGTRVVLDKRIDWAAPRSRTA